MKLLITAGGSGGKLWPISNDKTPKQFTPMLDKKSLFRINLEILLEQYSPEDILISTKRQFTHFMREQAPEIKEENIIYEPDFKRESGPGTLYALLVLSLKYPNEPFILVQAVCSREPKAIYLKMLKAMENMLLRYNEPITGGMRPEYPDMGSDYLKVFINHDAEIENDTKFYRTEEFVWRTGDLEKTKDLIQKNNVFFHTNHLCYYPKKILSEVKKYKPEWEEVLIQIKERLLKSPQNVQDVNIDDLYEKFTEGKIEDITSHLFNNRGMIAEVEYNWLHVGSWNSIYQVLPKDIDQNAVEGDAKLFESNNNLVLQKDLPKKMVLIGIENTTIVETEDSILICDNKNLADIKKYTSDL